eukprot:4731321-Amphidinium_carterae.1
MSEKTKSFQALLSFSSVYGCYSTAHGANTVNAASEQDGETLRERPLQVGSVRVLQFRQAAITVHDVLKSHGPNVVHCTDKPICSSKNVSRKCWEHFRS